VVAGGEVAAVEQTTKPKTTTMVLEGVALGDRE
jgi:hypothetical protein